MRKRIGEFLVEKGVLSAGAVDRVLQHARSSGLRFGDAAMDLGLIDRDTMISVFGPSYRVDFFHIEPEYFPKVTRDLLPLDLMVRCGALPLGYKREFRFFRARKMLNIGIINPERKDAIAEIERFLRVRPEGETIAGLKIYLVLSDQFLDVLDSVYQMSEIEIRALPGERVDGTLQLFIENVENV